MTTSILFEMKRGWLLQRLQSTSFNMSLPSSCLSLSKTIMAGQIELSGQNSDFTLNFSSLLVPAVAMGACFLSVMHWSASLARAAIGSPSHYWKEMITIIAIIITTIITTVIIVIKSQWVDCLEYKLLIGKCLPPIQPPSSSSSPPPRSKSLVGIDFWWVACLHESQLIARRWHCTAH